MNPIIHHHDLTLREADVIDLIRKHAKASGDTEIMTGAFALGAFEMFAATRPSAAAEILEHDEEVRRAVTRLRELFPELAQTGG